MQIPVKLWSSKEERKARIDRLTPAHWLFLLFWVMKPFYLWGSGTMQISDFIAMFTFMVWFLQRRGSVVIDRRELTLMGFVGCTYLINGIYAAIYKDTSFLMSSAYYTYNLLVVILFRDLMENKRFLKALLWASASNVLVQLGVLVTGRGNYFWGVFRFMGTFNDPNQYAFSMLTSFLMVYVLASHFKDLEKQRKKAAVVFVFMLVFYFIIQGGSTGMLLGITAFTIALLMLFLLSAETPFFIFLKMLGVLLILMLGVALFTLDLSAPSIDGSVESSTFLIYRVFDKIGKVEGGGVGALFADRGIDKVFEHPIYWLIGAGEGGYFRFPGSNFEVHSTLLGILFYYGILPFLVLMRWLRLNLRGVRKVLLPVYFALFIESMTLANQRQPVLWILILLGSLHFTEKNDLRQYRIMTTL